MAETTPRGASTVGVVLVTTCYDALPPRDVSSEWGTIWYLRLGRQARRDGTHVSTCNGSLPSGGHYDSPRIDTHLVSDTAPQGA
eukprot:1702056-Prymnesium_polylepis.1